MRVALWTDLDGAVVNLSTFHGLRSKGCVGSCFEAAGAAATRQRKLLLHTGNDGNPPVVAEYLPQSASRICAFRQHQGRSSGVCANIKPRLDSSRGIIELRVERQGEDTALGC